MYNIAKNININNIQFQSNCGYYSYITYKKDVNVYDELKSANKLLAKLKKLLIISQKILYQAQKF